MKTQDLNILYKPVYVSAWKIEYAIGLQSLNNVWFGYKVWRKLPKGSFTRQQGDRDTDNFTQILYVDSERILKVGQDELELVMDL